MASTSKLVATFRTLNEMEFQARMGTILTASENHPLLPVPRPEVLPSQAALRADETAYREAALAVQQRDMRQKPKRDEARERLSKNLHRLAVYLELAADGNMALLQATGFELRRESQRGANTSAPGTTGAMAAALAVSRLGPPEGFRVGLGPRPGTLLVDASRQRGAIAYEIQVTHGDPAQDEGWERAAIVTTVRDVLVEHQTPGPTWVRLRAVRAGGMNGPWTAPISVVVA
jgi:hypothetical protein